jgi:hypothetical protein
MKLSQFIFFTLFTFFSFSKIGFALCIYGDCKSGYGESVSKSGTHYKGEFENGVRIGNGTLVWPNGSNYEGFFKDDKFNGLGTFIWRDGTKYIGYWKNGLQHGEGEKTLPSGSSIYGKFKYGKLKKVVFIMEPGAQKEVPINVGDVDQKPVVKEVVQTKLQKQREVAVVKSEVHKPAEITADKPTVKQAENIPSLKIVKKPIAELNPKNSASDITQNSAPINADVPIPNSTVTPKPIVDNVAKKPFVKIGEEPIVAKWEQNPVAKVADTPIAQEVYKKSVVETKKPVAQQIVPTPDVEVTKFQKIEGVVKDFYAHNQNKVIILLALLLTIAFLIFLVKLFSKRNKDRKAVDALLNAEKESEISIIEENPSS